MYVDGRLSLGFGGSEPRSSLRSAGPDAAPAMCHACHRPPPLGARPPAGFQGIGTINATATRHMARNAAILNGGSTHSTQASSIHGGGGVALKNHMMRYGSEAVGEVPFFTDVPSQELIMSTTVVRRGGGKGALLRRPPPPCVCGRGGAAAAAAWPGPPAPHQGISTQRPTDPDLT